VGDSAKTNPIRFDHIPFDLLSYLLTGVIPTVLDVRLKMYILASLVSKCSNSDVYQFFFTFSYSNLDAATLAQKYI